MSDPHDPLSQLALKYGADKARDHWYTPHYHRRFSALQQAPVKLLEIGVGGYSDPMQGGPSLEMWRDYFPNGTIVGLDIEAKKMNLGSRVHIEQGDVTDRRVVHHLGQTYGPFDIIVDDGSHRCDDVMAAWVYLWEYLAEDGWYVVEDLQTSYWKEYGGSSERSGESTIGWIFGLINHLHYADLNIANYHVTDYDRTLVGIELARNIAFIRKGDNTKPSEMMPEHPHSLVGEDRPDGVSLEVTVGVKLFTKVEQPADRRVLVPYMKATEKVQCVIDCLRIQFVQPEVVKVDAGDAYWRMLRDAWADGREFMVVEHDVMVWPGSVEFLFSCERDWCVLPTLCHGRMYTTTLGAMRFGQTMIERNPGLWDRISPEWKYLDAHLSEEMGWPFITPHAHYPAAAHLNESQWPNDISMREIERRVGWHVQEIGGEPVVWMGDHKEETWQTS